MLHASLLLRVQDVPIPVSGTRVTPRIAILFSGGLDCTLLARLIHDILPKEFEIDLLNVAFENPRVLKSLRARSLQPQATELSMFSLCPDRRTGLASHLELLRVCPGRTWRMVTIDIAYSETLSHRDDIVSLIHPNNTEMDLSIACALYFAARGSGMWLDQSTGSECHYTTPARVLISGMGADEIFAGYARHATSFHREGLHGLLDALETDFTRLRSQNLGRDDRVISHWGKEARYPYLDEDLVSWALGLPIWEKCGFGQGEIDEDSNEHIKGLHLEPGKKLLRLLAWKLNMQSVAIEKKKAIQFGARTAKMEVGRMKGTQALF